MTLLPSMRTKEQLLEDEETLLAEIERLRGELDALQTHFDIKAKLSAEKDAEIEKLRALLREAYLALSFMPDPTRKLLDLRYRVREALGERDE